MIKTNIIAIASMVVMDLLSSKKVFIEDIVVDKQSRGFGFGRSLLNHIIFVCTDLSVDKIELTSRSERIEANLLYQKVGFKKQDTNYYQLILREL